MLIQVGLGNSNRTVGVLSTAAVLGVLAFGFRFAGDLNGALMAVSGLLPLFVIVCIGAVIYAATARVVDEIGRREPKAPA